MLRLSLALVLSVALLSFLAATGCTSPLSQKDPQTGQVASKEGATSGLYQNKCGGCHDLYPPHAYSAAQWQGVLQRMHPQTDLPPAELHRLMRWLQERN